jgi:hypothetical protein
MNIGQLMRSLAGDFRVQEPRSLELRPGQVVRGVLLQMLSDSEALLQLEGVQVRAILQASLQPGQTAWLQVMPPSPTGEIVLKPVDMPLSRSVGQDLGQLLKFLGLEDNEANRRLIGIMQREGLDLTKTNVRELAQAMRQAPAAVDSAKWTQAAVLALSRGLPLTNAVIQSLHQVLFGPPLERLLQQLEQGAAAIRAGIPGNAASLSSAPLSQYSASLAQLMDRLGQAIQQLRGLVAGMNARSAAPGEGAAAQPSALPAVPGQVANLTFPGPAYGQADGGAGRGASPAPFRAAAASAGAAGSTGGPTAEVTRAAPQGQGMPNPAAQHAASSSAAPSTAHPSTAAIAQLSVSSAGTSAAGTMGGAEAHAKLTPQQAETSGRSAGAQPEPAGEWIPRLLRMLGVETERSVLRLTQQHAGQAGRSGAEPGSPLPSPLVPQDLSHVPMEALRSGSAVETVKTLLLQLAASDDLPGGMREAVQQTLQHITGQQLLLSSDRSSAFTQLTVFLPLEGGDRDHPSAIHIQSRKKGANGGIDPDNCRLVFDLGMRYLGHTVIDVFVVERSIQLHVINDHPSFGQWVEEARPQLDEAFRKAGYRIASMKITPFPKEQADGAGKRHERPDSAPPVPDSLEYAPKPYKGVDLRI